MIYQKVSPGAKTAEFAYELTPAKMRANGRTTYEAVTDGGVAVVFSGWQGDL